MKRNIEEHKIIINLKRRKKYRKNIILSPIKRIYSNLLII